MLKKLRVGIAIVMLALITFLFLDFAALLPNSFKWLAEIQFFPALIALNIAVLAAIIVATLLFGRLYCSVICPMGIFQDVIAWFSKRKFAAGKKRRYTYSNAKNILRYSSLAVITITFLSGLSFVLGLTEPYSAYGRMITAVFKPIYMAGNNVLQSIFTSFNNYTFYRVEVSVLSVFTLVVGIITLIAISYLAWKHGRTYCNTICPVGSILGFLSKFSLLKVNINSAACNSCGVCTTKCKASCINSKAQDIDNSRCVTCFNCLGACKKNALSYGLKTKKAGAEIKATNSSKRHFLLTGLTTAVTAPAALAQNTLDNITGAKKYTRQTPISPPGSKSAKHLLRHCTSCHLCISRCPSKVLKPAFLEYGLGGIMQPMMSYEHGFCNYNCTICTEVCPNKAIEPLTKKEKHYTQVGRVIFNIDICVVETEGTNCGACAEHCPTQAVSMVPYEGHQGLTIPLINTDICIGCGGCEYICPVRPHRAIFVEGSPVHRLRESYVEEKKEDIVVDDFGF
jgi:hypothetical protein